MQIEMRGIDKSYGDKVESSIPVEVELITKDNAQ